MGHVALRSMTTNPPKYSEGDRVVMNHWYYKNIRENDEFSLMQRFDTFYNGTVIAVGASEYNEAYDWYVVELDDGRFVESWWMEAWAIKGLLKADGLPSQEVPNQPL